MRRRHHRQRRVGRGSMPARDVQSLRVDLHADEARRRLEQHVACEEIARVLDPDGVVGLEQRLRDQLERAERAAGNQDLVGRARDVARDTADSSRSPGAAARIPSRRTDGRTARRRSCRATRLAICAHCLRGNASSAGNPIWNSSGFGGSRNRRGGLRALDANVIGLRLDGSDGLTIVPRAPSLTV